MSVRIITGDAVEQLRLLPAERAYVLHLSPYYGLRDYGVAGQLGLEPTPDEYVAAMVGVFREVRRVLRPDGTLWLNIGDSYANDGKWGGHTGGKHAAALHDSPIGRNKRYTGYKPKDLIGIPWMLAFALRADGWWLRQDIIWAKPNPMPESVTDRCTKAHEYLFLLSKSERYYYDAEAIKEPHTWAHVGEMRKGAESKNGGSIERPIPIGRGNTTGSFRAFGEGGRNKRSVWTIATAPFPSAHFATFPPALVEPCILAGTSEKGCCPSCGMPWVRATKTEYDNPGNRSTNGPRSLAQRHETAGFAVRLEKRVETTGWALACKCHPAAAVPAKVLDPFGGAGTTAIVADRLGRNAILIELNPAYAEMAKRRIEDDAGLFANVAN